jgi:hypothetical protein
VNLTFDPPLKHESATCAEMTLREPTVGEVLKAEKAFALEEGGQARRVRNSTLIAAVSGVHIDLVRKMPASKFKDAAAYLNAFDTPADPKASRVTDEEVVILLGQKIEKMGRIVDQLELREPTTGEVEEAQRKLTANTSEAMRAMQIHLIALVAELPRPIVEAMPISIINQGSRYLTGFI